MTRKTIVLALLIASLAGNAAFVITAVLRARAPAADPFEQISLTAEQRAKFRAANDLFVSERARAHDELAKLRQELAREFLAGSPDRDRLLRVALEMAEIQAARRPKLVDHLLLLHGILSPVQRAIVAEQIRANASTCCPGCPGGGMFRKRQAR